MKKRQNLILKSFGAGSITSPSPKKISGWILENKMSRCDLISYKTELQLKEQKGYVDFSCAGGLFYGERIIESFPGIKSGFLRAEPYTDPEFLRLDSVRAAKICKKSYFSFPSPLELKIEDAYFKDRTEFIGSICTEYKKMMRIQRDLGVKSHIIISDRFDETELEELCRERVFFFSPDGGYGVLKTILEYQNSIAVKPEKLPVVFELLKDYEIKSVSVINGCHADFMSCLDHFDSENIISGGFSDDCFNDCWKNLKDESFVMR